MGVNKGTTIQLFAFSVLCALFVFLASSISRRLDGKADEAPSSSLGRRAIGARSAPETARGALPALLADQAAKEKRNFTEAARNILLDCGGNVASTVELFQTTYPDGDSFEIYSFELDDRLAPYFASYRNHHLMCPAAVTDKDGVIQSFAESPWSPHKGKNNGRDMQWGGGSLFSSENEKTSKDGGTRKLNYRKDIPAIDLAKWMKTNLRLKDYVIFKLDVEGAEYQILRKMLDEDVFKLVDKFYGEFHPWAPIGEAKSFVDKIITDLKKQGVRMLDWGAETANYEDILKLHKTPPTSAAGQAGSIYSSCVTQSGDRHQVSLGVAIGNNFRLANRIVETLFDYKQLKEKKGELNPPITLFVFADFISEHYETVQSWAKHFEIASRGERYFLPGVFARLRPNLRRKSILHARKIFQTYGLDTASYLAQLEHDEKYTRLMKTLGLHQIKPTVWFPPLDISILGKKYFGVRSVERNPKALRYLHHALKDKGGILLLDSDFDDSFQISVFLLDYLTDYDESNKDFYLVPLSRCIT